MTRPIRFATCLLATLLLSACVKRVDIETSRDPDQALAQALADLRGKKFRQAQDRFSFIIFNFPGTHHSSDAQFYLAESYYEAGDFTQAQTEYDFYVQNFPSGRFQEDAELKLALSSLRSAPGFTRDQSRVMKARDLLDEFVAAHPDSPLLARADSARAAIVGRLAEKEFDAARLYFRAGEFGSALVYYEYIARTFPDSLWPEADRQRFATCYAKTGRPVAPEIRAPEPGNELREVVYFAAGSSDLAAADSAIVARLAERLRDLTQLRVAVIGYCDSTELAAFGDTIALARARTAASLLMRLGVEEARIDYTGAGVALASAGIVDLDRRVEFIAR